MTKMPSVEEQGSPATSLELEELEARLGSSLPAAYRSFLTKHNGGYPVPDAFKFYGAETGSRVQAFYSVSGPHREDRFGRVLEVFRDRVPEGLLPFAYDPFGNLLCIRYVGPGTGRVYFWDHEREASDDETPDFSNLRLVANSFEDFMEGLYELGA